MYCYSCGRPVMDGTTICSSCGKNALPLAHLNFKVIPNEFTPNGSLEISLQALNVNEVIKVSKDQNTELSVPMWKYSMDIKTPDGETFENTIVISSNVGFSFKYNSVDKKWFMEITRS